MASGGSPNKEPKTSREHSSDSVLVPTVGYHFRKMSTKEMMIRCPCRCDICVACIKKCKKQSEGSKMFAPSWNTAYCTPIVYRKVKGDPKMSYEGIKAAYESSLSEKAINNGHLLRLVTYVDPIFGNAYEPAIYYELIQLCCHLFDADLAKVMAAYDRQFPTDFLRRVLTLFAQTWQAFLSGKARAACSAFQTRRFLTHVLSFPLIASRLFGIVTNSEYWPILSPVEIFEALTERKLCCSATAALLCNITRSDKMAEFLTRKTRCVEHLRNNPGFVKAMAERDDLGLLLLQLAVNLVPFDGFPKFLINHDSGYIMEAVILPLIAVPSICSVDEKVVWALLRNFVMTKAGRKYVMKKLDSLLGWFLLPITGPEDLFLSENTTLPDQLKDLTTDKHRVEDKVVREMILDIMFSLCRFKKDREMLREKGAYQILKYYQIAEETVEHNLQLIEKVQIIAGLLNPEQETGIEYDDLWEGIWQEVQCWAVNCDPIKVRGTVIFR